MQNGQDIVNEARKHLGVRFEHQGRNPNFGIDCIGLLILASVHRNYKIKDYTRYKPTPNPNQLIQNLDDNLDPISKSELKIGDIIVFWMRRPHLPQHVGIKTDYGIIHTHTAVNKVAEHVLSEYWKKRMHSFYRFRN